MQPQSFPRPRVLVVDDAEELRLALEAALTAAGFDVTCAESGEQALALLPTAAPEIVLLDVGLPGIDGVETCRQLRLVSQAYVLMLTAHSDEIDHVVGLSVGADDYVTKPFSYRELVARLHALLRRTRVVPVPVGAAVPPVPADGIPPVPADGIPPVPADGIPPVPAGRILRVPAGGVPRATPEADPDDDHLLRHADLVIDPGSREVTVAGVPVPLTKLEYDLLELLVRKPRVVHTREQLLHQLWGRDWFGDDHVVDVQMSKLRRKLGDTAKQARYILTIRGVGFRMAAPRGVGTQS